jgi:hypothetical protein
VAVELFRSRFNDTLNTLLEAVCQVNHVLFTLRFCLYFLLFLLCF